MCVTLFLRLCASVSVSVCTCLTAIVECLSEHGMHLSGLTARTSNSCWYKLEL